ncbi:MAG: cytochrome c [Anaerolineae bacterium]|nr:cytochrome c [Anaerolineae bacterium]
MKNMTAKILFILLTALSLMGCGASTTALSPEDASADDSAGTAASADTTLTFVTSAGTRSFTLDYLKAAIPTATLTVEDPVYDRPKTYEGFWLTDLLNHAKLLDGDGDMLLFRAADGYETRLDREQLQQGTAKGLVAFRDVEAENGWETFKHGKTEMVPAPYYLVWAADEEGTAESFSWEAWPWPYQLTHIEMIDFATTYDRLYPPEIKETTTAHEGFKLFTETCLKCHSINLQGGVEGPELNIPQNITEYRDQETLKAFIKDSTSFRAGSKMPPMGQKLTDEEIDTILTYIAWMADYKQQVD